MFVCACVWERACVGCAYDSVSLVLNMFAYNVFSTLQLLADLSFFSPFRVCVAFFQLLCCVYPEWVSFSVQLTLSLNNIKIMSNKSDTANEIDVYYVAVAFFSIGIILLLFVCFRLSLPLLSAERKIHLYFYSLLFIVFLFGCREIRFFFASLIMFVFVVSWVLITGNCSVFWMQRRFRRVAKMIKSNGVFFVGFFIELNDIFLFTQRTCRLISSLPFICCFSIYVFFCSFVRSLAQFSASQLKLHLYATLNVQIVFLFCCVFGCWEMKQSNSKMGKKPAATTKTKKNILSRN